MPLSIILLPGNAFSMAKFKVTAHTCCINHCVNMTRQKRPSSSPLSTDQNTLGDEIHSINDPGKRRRRRRGKGRRRRKGRWRIWLRFVVTSV
jgi:hypothetical protein